MKTARLDQILYRLGYVTDSDIRAALERQKANGGRFGRNLVLGGALTEAQLAEALAAQYGLPWVPTVERQVPAELLDGMPAGSVTERLALPLDWDPSGGTLRLVMADPTDEDTVERAIEAFGAMRALVVIAPEDVLRHKIAILAGRQDPPAQGGPVPVALPELFELERRAEAEAETGEDPAEPRRTVLMVTGSAAHRNFLPPIFEREGTTLHIAGNAEEVRIAMTDRGFDALIVSSDLTDAFSEWVRDGRVPPPSVDVSVFSSVSANLLENPAPYASTYRSLITAVQALAESRWEGGDVPAQGLVADDLAALCERYGLRRLAADGLQLAAHLLTPAPKQRADHEDPFRDFAASVDLANRLRFPFRLDTLLGACRALYQGKATPGEADGMGEEVHLAAQMLALVWFRHHQISLDSEGDQALLSVLGAALRKQAGRLASMDLVEVYLRVLAERGGTTGSLRDREVMLVGGGALSDSLAARLARVGCRTVVTENLVEARTMVERRPPAALVIDVPRFGDHAVRFARIARLDGDFLLYAFTDSTDPATTLMLLDAGVDDVFGPPHDFDLIAARVSRAVRLRGVRVSRAERQGFSASFSVFSFLDLVQALGQARKTARIELVSEWGERAEVYLHDGVMEHAECGSTSGNEAVYRVIAWEEAGAFTVHPEETARLRTITDSTGHVLMEGCRLLDESRV